MATAEGDSVAAANDPLIDGLLQGSQWDFGTGPHVLTYSFNLSGVPGSGNWTAAQQAGVRAAFAAWSAVADIQFKEVKSGTYFYQSTADIALSLTGTFQQQTGYTGEGVFPDAAGAAGIAQSLLDDYAPNATSASYANAQGDVFLDNKALPYQLNPLGFFGVGGYSMELVLHEIGHALGLKHPHDDGGNGKPTFSALGLASLDTDYNTVMSYNAENPWWIDWGNPTTPMPIDILAIQYLYGVNRSTNTGNNTYYLQDNGSVRTIWDAGGYDTLDASKLPSQSYLGYTAIDLRPGQISRYIDWRTGPEGQEFISAVGMSYTPTETQDGPVAPIDNLIERAIGSSGTDYITGNDANNTLLGGGGNDELEGGAGNDYLDGGTGADQMRGDAGDDTYIIDNLSDFVQENADDGVDTVISSVPISAIANVENYTYTGKLSWSITTDASDNIVIGGSGADTIYTNAGNDTLNGGAGADTLTGGTGDDTYVIDNIGDKVIENANEGNDTVRSSILLTALINNVENYIYTGASAWTFSGTDGDNLLVGGSGKDTLSGGAGNDTLDGGAGADKLVGGIGDDTYVIDNAGDQVIEAAGGGTDLIRSSVTINLAAGAFAGQEIENVTLTGAAAINVTGNAIGNILTGNGGANIIDGGAGADTMAGGLGNDTYVIDDANDKVIENAGEGTDTVKSSILLTATIANVENYTYTGTSDWSFTGTSDANVITGGGGKDTLDGGAGADTLSGGVGDDTYIVDNAGDKVIEAANQGTDTIVLATDYSNSTFSYVLATNVENFDASQVAGVVAVTATGNILTNIMTGGAGNDSLDGGAGADILTGGTGDDTYVIDNIGDKVIEKAGEGNDTVRSSILLTSVIANVENYTYTGALAWSFTGDDGDNALTGGSGKDMLTGGLGNDTLSGGAGADKLIGGSGDDTYIIDNVGDTVVEAIGEGTDLIKSSVTINLGAGAFIGQDIENVTLTGSAAVNITGNAINNILTGNDGANVIDGGAGADTMAGGLGNDTYVLDNIGDTVTELFNAGIDTVKTSVAITTAISNVENYLYTGAADWVFTGNALANAITGGSGNDTLDGGAGADTLAGGLGNDTYIVDDVGDKITEAANAGTADTVRLAGSLSGYILGANLENLDASQMMSDETLTGNAVNNVITGGSGNDTLNGGAGADTLTGGTGDDTYVIDNIGDKVIEKAGEGNDTVKSSILLASLIANVENYVYTGTLAWTFTGDDGDNALTGGSGKDVLAGGGGDDTLDGGAGADKLIGGEGDDTYVIDNVGDIVVEAVGGGTDLIKSSVSLNLGAGAFIGQDIENVILTGAAAINVTGNALDNVLTGNAAANIIDGGAGADVMAGGLGNDTYIIDDAKDTVTEAADAGTDTVKTSIAIATAIDNVENYTFTGSGDWHFTGNALANVITGGSGNDTLDGGAGADTLIGGAGDDTYIVDNAADKVIEAAGKGNDTIISYLASTVGVANVENYLYYGNGNWTFTGTNGNETITDYSGSGYDVISGGGGDDTLIARNWTTTFDGGAGNDTITFANSQAGISAYIQKTATGSVGAGGSISFSNVENLIGSKYNDQLTGDSENNVLDGHGGHDTLTGGGGKDTYVYSAAGQLTIVNGGQTGTAAGTLDITTGLTEQDLWFVTAGSDLLVEELGTSNWIRFQDWFGGNSSAKISEIDLADGSKINASGIAQLTAAMSSYSTSQNFSATQTGATMPQDQSLQNAIAAAWHNGS
jgi:serralysin